jgi:hypothetical protein
MVAPGKWLGEGTVHCYLSNYSLNELYARHQLLMSVILTTEEAKIRRVVVRSQPRQNSLQDSISKKPFTKKGWWSGSRCRP